MEKKLLKKILEKTKFFVDKKSENYLQGFLWFENKIFCGGGQTCILFEIEQTTIEPKFFYLSTKEFGELTNTHWNLLNFVKKNYLKEIENAGEINLELCESSNFIKSYVKSHNFIDLIGLVENNKIIIGSERYLNEEPSFEFNIKNEFEIKKAYCGRKIADFFDYVFKKTKRIEQSFKIQVSNSTANIFLQEKSELVLARFGYPNFSSS